MLLFSGSIKYDEAKGASPYGLHSGQEFDGISLPFGCGVFFKPAATKYTPSKAAPRMQYGVFLGYQLAPGGSGRASTLLRI